MHLHDCPAPGSRPGPRVSNSITEAHTPASNPPEQSCVLHAILSLLGWNMSLRKVTENYGHFPNNEAMFKLI